MFRNWAHLSSPFPASLCVTDNVSICMTSSKIFSVNVESILLHFSTFSNETVPLRLWPAANLCKCPVFGSDKMATECRGKLICKKFYLQSVWAESAPLGFPFASSSPEFVPFLMNLPEIHFLHGASQRGLAMLELWIRLTILSDIDT